MIVNQFHNSANPLLQYNSTLIGNALKTQLHKPFITNVIMFCGNNSIKYKMNIAEKANMECLF